MGTRIVSPGANTIIKPGTITADMLADGAVTGPKLASGAVNPSNRFYENFDTDWMTHTEAVNQGYINLQTISGTNYSNGSAKLRFWGKRSNSMCLLNLVAESTYIPTSAASYSNYSNPAISRIYYVAFKPVISKFVPSSLYLVVPDNINKNEIYRGDPAVTPALVANNDSVYLHNDTGADSYRWQTFRANSSYLSATKVKNNKCYINYTYNFNDYSFDMPDFSTRAEINTENIYQFKTSPYHEVESYWYHGSGMNVIYSSSQFTGDVMKRSACIYRYLVWY